MRKIIRLVIITALILFVVTCGYKYINYGDVFCKSATEENGWELILVNQDYCLPKDYCPELIELSNGEKVDARIYPDLQQMFDDARRLGYSLKVRSGYRTYDRQKELWEERAETAGGGSKLVQKPGTSEHQTGLAVDVNVSGKTKRDVLYAWLKENSYKYGFILRYPQGKEDITGIGYEPWHFRYVGIGNAAIIYNENLTLEEYVDMYK